MRAAVGRAGLTVIKRKLTDVSDPFARARVDKPNVGEGLQTLAQNHRRGLKTPTYKVGGLPMGYQLRRTTKSMTTRLRCCEPPAYNEE